VRSLILQGRIRTTVPKAKAARSLAEELITYGKRAQTALKEGDSRQHQARALHYRRLAYSFLQDDDVVRKVFGELAQRYQERPGGYTRMVRAGFRQGDAAPVAILELLE
jgi:large subunit ribosomal protein L17